MSEHVKPCRHMEGLLNKHADGRLRGFAKLYALAHLARCNRCRQFLRFIEQAIIKLREDREKVPEDVMARLSEGAWRNEING